MVDTMYATLTIPALKTLIREMNDRSQNGDITVPSKARKADIVALITDEIDRLWDEAIAENRAWVARKIADGYRKSVSIEPYVYPVRPVPSLMARAEILAGKVNAYFRQNGAIKLTAAQWQRVRKAMAKHEVTYADMAQFLVFP